MNKESIITILITAATALALIFFIPKKRIKEAFLAFLFAQLISWPSGLLQVLFGLREFPVKFFPKATEAGILLNFLLYPALFTIFQIHFPNDKNTQYKLSYSVFFIVCMTLFDAFAAYTNLVVYKSWSWFRSIILFSISFFAARRYVIWFFKKLLYSNYKV